MKFNDDELATLYEPHKQKKTPADKEREAAQIIITHLGKAARLASQTARESDAAGHNFFMDLYAAMDDIYHEIQKKFPGIEEAKK